MIKHTVSVGNVMIGGSNPVVIQSMTNSLTSDINETVTQIIELYNEGAEIVRVTVNDMESAKSIPLIKNQLIKKKCGVPIVGDFHFNGHKLLDSVPDCAVALDKYRINPGNVGNLKNYDRNFAKFIEIACEHNKPVRVGVNWGSLDQNLLKDMMDSNLKLENPLPNSELIKNALIKSCIQSEKLAVDIGLPQNKIILSCKVSNVSLLIDIYQELNKLSNCPLHIGLTEAGVGEFAVVSSSIAIGYLLKQNIGNTIRVSLTPEKKGYRKQEVKIAKHIIQSIGLRNYTPSVNSCPGCGRTSNTYFQELAKEVQIFVDQSITSWKKKYIGIENLKIAVMGCVVNGPGESKHADIGISLPGNGEAPVAPVFIDGEHFKTLKGETISLDFIEIINSYIKKNYKQTTSQC